MAAEDGLRERTMHSVIVALLMTASAGLANAENLCPTPDTLPAQDGTRMTEDVFELPSGLDATEKLSAFLNKEHLTYQFEQVVNAFLAKGVMLRQGAIIAAQARDLAKLRGANTDDLAKATREAKSALETYCSFMADAVVAE